MNAWQPQASYPCGNFSDTSVIDILIRSAIKGSLAVLSQSRFVLKITIKKAFTLVCYVRFLFSLSFP